ncbi:unnamed protein product [Parajaminaea phylloscopi]
MINGASLPLLALAAWASTACAAPLDSPLGSTAVIGKCGVNAQHMFVGTDDKVYILDRSEHNPLLDAAGKPAIAAEWSLSAQKCRPMAVDTNQFCAGGGVLGDGSWGNLGGNPAQNTNAQGNGLRAIRHLTPCDGGDCTWQEAQGLQLQVDRWYPSVETAGDGSLLVFGGYNAQVFMPYPKAGNTPTVESYPTRGGPGNVPVLDRAWPFSLYPLTTHLSDGRVLIVAGNETVLYNPASAAEAVLPGMPNGPRTYPSGGASVLLPLRPSQGYREEFMACGGTNLPDWGNAGAPPADAYKTPANAKCDVITPLDPRPQWTSVADLPDRRVMGNFVILPDGKIALLNGARNGVQGFGQGPGESQASDAALVPHMYDPETNTWETLAPMTIPRGYHSSATLLPDGSVLSAGSSPHQDVSTLQPFPTEYTLEVLRPPYFNKERPSNADLPTKYPHGGAGFNVTFPDEASAQSAQVRLIRSGWSTHGLQMGQRSYELDRTVDGKTVTFAGMTRNTNLFPPGSALAFLVVKGVPSQGRLAIVGDGKAPEGRLTA